MNRRAFVTGLGAVLAAPLAEAQQTGKIWRIGLLGGSSPTTPEAARPWEALLQGLRELGYVEGQNLAVERRWAEGRAERYQELAAELVALKPDVIVAATTPSVSADKRATSMARGIQRLADTYASAAHADRECSEMVVRKSD